MTIICSSAVIRFACVLRPLLRHLRLLALRSGFQADSTNCVATCTLRLPQAHLCHSPSVLPSEGSRLTRLAWLPSLFSQPLTGWLLAPQTNPCHPPVQWIRPRQIRAKDSNLATGDRPGPTLSGFSHISYLDTTGTSRCI